MARAARRARADKALRANAATRDRAETARGGDEGSGGDGFGGDAGSGGGSGDCVGDEEYDALADACLVPIPCNEAGSPFGGGDGSEHESLDLSAVSGFLPIAAVDDPFIGTFDGARRALVGPAINYPGGLTSVFLPIWMAQAPS